MAKNRIVLELIDEMQSYGWKNKEVGDEVEFMPEIEPGSNWGWKFRFDTNAPDTETMLKPMEEELKRIKAEIATSTEPDDVIRDKKWVLEVLENEHKELLEISYDFKRAGW